MHTLLHGEDTLKSQQELDLAKAAAKTSNKEIYEISATEFTADTLSQLAGKTLFGGETLVIVNNFWSKNKKIAFDLPADVDIIFRESKKLYSLPALKTLDVKRFDPPVVVFKFLDSLSPGNQRIFMPLFETYAALDPVEIVFTMIVRHFRLMILAISDVNNTSEDLKNLQTWQVGKLAQSGEKFGLVKLQELYRQLLILDHQVKSGSNSNLRTLLELLLLKL